MLKNVENTITNVALPYNDGVMLYPNKIMYEDVCVFDEDDVVVEDNRQKYMLFIFQAKNYSQNAQQFCYQGKKYYYGDKFIYISNGDKLYDANNKNEIFEFNISKFGNIKNCWITYDSVNGVIINNPNNNATTSLKSQVESLTQQKIVKISIDSKCTTNWGIKCGNLEKYFNSYNGGSYSVTPCSGKWFEITVNYPNELTLVYGGDNYTTFSYRELPDLILIKNNGISTPSYLNLNNSSKIDLVTYTNDLVKLGMVNIMTPIKEIDDLNYRLNGPKLVDSELYGGCFTFIPTDENGHILTGGIFAEKNDSSTSPTYNFRYSVRCDDSFFSFWFKDYNDLGILSYNPGSCVRMIKSSELNKYKTNYDLYLTRDLYSMTQYDMTDIRAMLSEFNEDDLDGSLLLIPLVMNKEFIELINT